mmetsp:Transcript_29382/g.73962  ORF Transcript_29382/g.73962 Transcript_29382/m.73962 type:complete len:202 (-) Transcript_29382:263-868(-)
MKMSVINCSKRLTPLGSCTTVNTGNGSIPPPPWCIAHRSGSWFSSASGSKYEDQSRDCSFTSVGVAGIATVTFPEGDWQMVVCATFPTCDALANVPRSLFTKPWSTTVVVAHVAGRLPVAFVCEQSAEPGRLDAGEVEPEAERAEKLSISSATFDSTEAATCSPDSSSLNEWKEDPSRVTATACNGSSSLRFISYWSSSNG